MKTDSLIGRRDQSVHDYRQPVLQLINPYLDCLQGLPDPAAKRAVHWTPLAASMAAVLMALDGSPTLRARCGLAGECLQSDFQGDRSVGRTYNGLLKALVRQSSSVLPVLKTSLRLQASMVLVSVPRIGGYALLAVDGSKMELPRTADLEKQFGIADNGRCPQALITAIVEVHTGLAWDWRIDPGRGSEKDRLVEMIGALPDDALLLADANFMGYPIWSAMEAAGKSFLIRVAGHAHLLRDLCPETRLERRHDDVVYAWPVDRQAEAPPLRLRLICVQKQPEPVYLLTNVLDHRRLREKTAGQIYRRRWGVETFYRTLKRTLDCVKLRSRSGRRAQVELEWAMLAITVMTLASLNEQHRQGVDVSRFSPAAALEAIRQGMRWRAAPPPSKQALADLKTQLGRACRDTYRRKGSKQSRYRPVTNNTPKSRILKPPKIRKATAAERRRAAEHHAAWAA